MTELLEKFEVMLNNQRSTNERIEELTTKMASCCIQQQQTFKIPTGCVKIRSFFSDKFLTVSSYDSQRRQLMQETTSGGGQQWTLVRQGDIYRITRRQGQEDLYAAMGDLAYDSQRRRVFTWIPGFGDDQGKWEIEEAPGFPGMVHIRSAYFGEYLYAANFDNFVFTWRPKEAAGRDSQYVWKIEQC